VAIVLILLLTFTNTRGLKTGKLIKYFHFYQDSGAFGF